MNDLLNSFIEWFKEKTTSPLYATFIVSLILWNWKFFYILFWQSEEKLSSPTIEYVQENILSNQSYLYHTIYFLILPALSTYFIIWWLPILTNWAHKKHLDFFYKRKIIIDNAKLNYERKEKDTLSSISLVKKQKAVVEKEIKKNMTSEERWEVEFEIFKKNPLYGQMAQLKDIIYQNSGLTRRYIANVGWTLRINSDILALADTKELITLSGKNDTEKIELTPKGKFFFSKYLE